MVGVFHGPVNAHRVEHDDGELVAVFGWERGNAFGDDPHAVRLA